MNQLESQQIFVMKNIILQEMKIKNHPGAYSKATYFAI